MSTEDLIRNGIRAAKEGNEKLAQALLSKAVLQDPSSEEAWWWLGLTLEDPGQRTYCFQKVLDINPNHTGANAKLYPPKIDAFIPEEDSAIETPPAPPAEPEGAGSEPDLWEKPSVQKSKRSSTQQVVIILLVIAVFIVLSGGGAFIFLDSTGFFSSSVPPPSPVNPTSLPPGSTDSGNVLVLPPTWTPTIEPTQSSTDTPEPSSTPEFTPTKEILTPEVPPSIDDAEAILITSGTGSFTLDPDAMRVFRFGPSSPPQIQSVASLGFKLIGLPSNGKPPLQLFVWNHLEETWAVLSPNWGDTIVFPPGLYLNEEGAVIAALWNWDVSPVVIQNASVSYSIITPQGDIVSYGLNDEGTIRVPNTPTVSPTPGNFDG